MAVRMRITGISSRFTADEIECLVRLAARTAGGPVALGTQECELATRAARYIHDLERMGDPDVANAARQAVAASAATNFTAPDDLRGCMADGYTSDDVEDVLGRLSQLSNLNIVCVWDHHFGYGFDGSSNFYIEADGWLYDIVGELWSWLNVSPDDSAAPPSPGVPASWVGTLSHHVTIQKLELAEPGSHNLAVADRT